MKKTFTLCLIVFGLISYSQTVTDFDGNVYDEIKIGNQTWLQQNLKSLHYSDGELIPDVLGYQNKDSLIQIYGRLYTWNATMRGSTTPMAQGVCPDGWHIPSTEEWIVLEDYLGGFAVAGGAMKSTNPDHWNPPNTGATNSSGFTALAAGEYDTPNGVFQFLMRYAVFWTSTETSSTKARERFLSYNSAACDIYDWHKSLNYSIRCVKDAATGMGEDRNPAIHIFPNPTFSSFTISIPSEKEEGIATLFDSMGRMVAENAISDFTNHLFETDGLTPGTYLLKIRTESRVYEKKVLKLTD